MHIGIGIKGNIKTFNLTVLNFYLIKSGLLKVNPYTNYTTSNLLSSYLKTSNYSYRLMVPVVINKL